MNLFHESTTIKITQDNNFNSHEQSINKYQIKFIMIVLIAIATNIFQFTVLSEKYFFDSNRILSLIENDAIFQIQNSYNITAYFSNVINIFGFTTLLHWSIAYSIVFNLLLYIFFKKVKFNSIYRLFWVCACLGLLNLYTFSLGKDIFQFILYFLIFILLQSNKDEKRTVILFGVCILLLLTWGIVFRIYFIFVAIYSLMTYILIRLYTSARIKHGIVILAIFGVWLSLYFLSLIAPLEYETVLSVHDRLNAHRFDSASSQTIIIDIIPNQGRLSLFIVNYIISLFRMLIPIELLFSLRTNIILYIPFFIFQIMLTYFVFFSLKRILNKEASPIGMQVFCLYFGYLLGSALFEPDFGSWIRHEITLFPIFMILINNTYFLNKTNVKEELL